MSRKSNRNVINSDDLAKQIIDLGQTKKFPQLQQLIAKCDIKLVRIHSHLFFWLLLENWFRIHKLIVVIAFSAGANDCQAHWSLWRQYFMELPADWMRIEFGNHVDHTIWHFDGDAERNEQSGIDFEANIRLDYAYIHWIAQVTCVRAHGIVHILRGINANGWSQMHRVNWSILFSSSCMHFHFSFHFCQMEGIISWADEIAE